MANADDVAELEAIAKFVLREPGWCSHNFVRLMENPGNQRELGAAARRVILEVERSGRHWTSAEIAARLRNEAEKLKAEEGNP